MTEWIGLAIFVGTVIYTAGTIISSTRNDVKQLRNDLNGIGTKVRIQQNKQHTRDLLHIAMTDDRKERLHMVDMLKDD